jgi:hypothetical protein
MGIGVLGDANLIIKRKFRWTFRVENLCNGGQIEEHFVKLASRPNLTIEETELNFLNAKTFIPGKATWETITVTYIDVAGHPQGANAGNQALWQWLASVYEFTNPAGDADVTNRMGSKRSDYEGTGVLSLFDGCGTEIERWRLRHMFPTAINFGDLDYGSSEEATIELTLRYSSVDYQNFCPGYSIEGCCSAC